MKTAEILLATSVLSFGLFVGYSAVTSGVVTPASVFETGTDAGTLSRRAGSTAATSGSSAAARSGAHATPASAPASASTKVSASASAAFATLGAPATPAANNSSANPAADPLLLRQRIAQLADGTYIDELLAARDSALARWPERTLRPLRVWVGVRNAAITMPDDWNEAFISAVQSAFNTWSDTGIPVRFSFVADSTTANVHVSFVENFPTGISGKTVWSRNEHWWLLSGNIELGMSHPNGGTVTPEQMYAIALHEVGHLLGLDHSSSSDNIMAAQVRARDLSPADRATVRALYSVPAGSLRLPTATTSR